MDRYEEYKDSGVEWIGEIPAGWEVRRISSLYEARNEKVSDRDYPPLSVTMQGIVPQLETAAKTQDGENRKLVKSGDFAINSRSDRRGACGISAYDGSVTLITNVLAPKDQASMNPRYYSHLFRSEGFADEYYRQGTGIVDDLWSTNWTRMKNILVACPSLVEQASIAEYLDAKTTEIDSLVEDCEREVELLQEYRKAVVSEAVTKGLDPNAPMKDSGIDWIGEIPEKWSVPKLSQLAIKIGSGKTPHGGAEIYSTEGTLFLRSQNIYNEGLKLEDVVYISDSIDEQMAGTRVYEGDVLLNITGGSIGRSALYVLKEHANVNQHVCIIRLKNSIVPGFIHYYWISELGSCVIDLHQTGANREGLNFSQIGNARIPLPLFHEQLAIVAYLDAKTAEIDSLIADYQSMVDKLREYRKSLISEAVTGKFKVPGVA